MDRPIAVDLFAGVGGFSLGFEQAGFDIAAAVEIDPIHAACHKFNFPNCAVIPRSIVGLTAAEIRKISGLGKRRIHVVVGGAPCQGFSLMGQRVLDDPRNSLVNEYVRVVSELDASYFVFENVKGLTLGKHRQFLEELILAFGTHGYNVRVPWQVLDTSLYGVPQCRERLILFGAKKGLKLPRYPLPTARPAGSKSDLLKLPEGPSCADALDDIPDADGFPELIGSDQVSTGKWAASSRYASELRCMTPEAWHYGYPRNWNREALTSSRRTHHTEISRNRFAETDQGKSEPISRFFRLPADGVSNTLRAGTDSARGAFTSPRPIHYRFPRCITVREMARLHGFPDWFRFQETKWHGARQIGNAVPPPLARVIANEVINAIGVTPERPQQMLELGETELLRMDMRQAAAYWKIDVIIGKRDRKSGTRKRRQWEVEAERAFSVLPANSDAAS